MKNPSRSMTKQIIYLDGKLSKKRDVECVQTAGTNTTHYTGTFEILFFKVKML